MRAQLLAFLVLFLVLCSGAQAWTLGEGSEISQGSVTYTVGQATELERLTFEAATGAPIFETSQGAWTLDMQGSGPGTFDWVIVNMSLPYRLEVSGSPSVAGTMRVAGLVGVYAVRGVAGTPEFTVSGPDASWAVPAGFQSIVVTPAGVPSSGPRIGLSAHYSTQNASITAAVTLLDSDGSALAGQSGSVVVRLFSPATGQEFAVPAVYEGPVAGVYRAWANLTPPEAGVWIATAEYGVTVASTTVLVTGGSLDISTAFDVWIPILIWGGLTLLALYFTAWFPAVCSILALLVQILPTPPWTLEASVLLVVLAWALHALATAGLIPQPFTRK